LAGGGGRRLAGDAGGRVAGVAAGVSLGWRPASGRGGGLVCAGWPRDRDPGGPPSSAQVVAGRPT
ncbi:MAG: hypothetical protein M3Z75_31985, partial [Actinomycetota bacterium]|nr:hypothetical protein [Actinomycetota bacterium]